MESVVLVMPLIRLTADAFGMVTICLVAIAAFFGLLCIYRLVYFQLRIRRRCFLQLSYFNGPWLTRIALILVAIWWGFGEVVRLTLLKGKGRLFSSLTWQKDVCKFYIVSNLGFAEPSVFLMLGFLLRASLQRRETGTLSPRWNRKTVGYVLFYSLPVFIMQLALILIGPKFIKPKSNHRSNLTNFFSSSVMNEQISICTNPLVSTMILGLFHSSMICYICYIGTKVVSLVINKGLRLRVYILVASVIIFIPMRVLLLGLSVLPHRGHFVFEAMVFAAFVVLLVCVVVGVCMLVYFPVADSLALQDIGHIRMDDMPYDDYYSDGASLIANQSHQETDRNSDASAKHGSISFRGMLKDEPSASGSVDVSFFPSNSLHVVTPLAPSQPSVKPMVPLSEVLIY